MPENWQQVKEVLAAVLEHEPGDRLAYLERICPEPSLRREVASLLAAHEETDDVFLESSAVEIGVLRIGTKLGPYQIVAPLGAGGMGEVYEARDTRLGRAVAIKVLPPAFLNDPERLSRFQREARMLAALNHPNIATIYGLEHSDGIHFLILELVPGETLRERITREGRVPVKEALEICRQITEALQGAHEKGIIHRDLKPANVKVTSQGRVKVLDFGLAKGFAADGGPSPSDGVTLTTVGSERGRILGTPPYMSPEQARGKPVDNRTDIWSFGCVLYELLTGRQAFRGETFADTLSAVLEREPDWELLPASTPTKIRDLLRRTLQKDSQQRLRDMAEARIEIQQAQGYASAEGPQVDPLAFQRASPGQVSVRGSAVASRRVRSLVPVLLAAVVLVAGVAAFGPIRKRIRGWVEIGALPQERQLAVLPFEVVGSDPGTKAFADGLAVTLTAKLTQLTAEHALQVVPASEVRARHVASSESARQELGVNLILAGSLQQSAGMARVTYELVDTRTRHQLRADTITIAAANLFAGEDQVIESVLRMLELELQPAERENLSKRGTLAADAYDFYLQGRGYLENYDKAENVQNAIDAFERALATDPTYALAYTGLGEAYWLKYQETKETQWVKPAQEACARALALDDRLAPAHACLGRLSAGAGQYQKAVLEFGRALEAEPTSDDAYRGLADAYEQLGALNKAEATYRRAIQLRPHYWASYSWLGGFYYDHDRFADAEAMFKQVIALVPDSFRGYYNLGATLNGEGRYQEAIAVIQHSIDIRPAATAYTNLGNAYFYLRRYDEATSAYEQAIKLRQGDYLLWWNLADGYFWNPGKHAQAAHAYRQAISLARERLTVNPKDSFVLGILATCHAMVGEQSSAMGYLRQGLQVDPSGPEMRFKAALVYNQFGDINEALKWLDKAVTSGYSQTVIRDTPNFDLLRSNQHFQELLRAK